MPAGPGTAEREVVAEERAQRAVKRDARLKLHSLLNAETGLYALAKACRDTVEQNKNKEPLRFAQRVVADVRRWQWALNPRYDHDYFLETVRRLGKDPKRDAFMRELRRLHKGEVAEAEFLAGAGVEELALRTEERGTGRGQREGPRRGKLRGGKAEGGPKQAEGQAREDGDAGPANADDQERLRQLASSRAGIYKKKSALAPQA